MKNHDKAVELLRQRARQASAAVETLLRWSYNIENVALYGAPEGPRTSTRTNPLGVIEKANTEQRTNRFIRSTAREVLDILHEPTETEAHDKRKGGRERERQERDAARKMHELFERHGAGSYERALGLVTMWNNNTKERMALAAEPHRTIGAGLAGPKTAPQRKPVRWDGNVFSLFSGSEASP